MTGITRRTALAAAALTPLSGSARAQPSAPSGLIIAMPTHPEVLEPVLGNNLPKLRSLPNLFDGLLAIDARDGVRIRPALAERWRRVDARVLEFDLRRDVVFHDGSPMTAEDVVFSLGPERGRGPGGAGRTVTPQYLSTIERVETTGPHAVRVTTRAPDPLIEQRLAGWSAEIVSQRAFRAASDWDRWAAAPVGTGPYRMAESRTDVRLLLRRHDRHWAGPAPYESLDFRIVPELAARVAGLRTGDFDIIVDVSPDLIPEVERDRRFLVAGGSIPNVRFVNCDIGHPLLADARIRRALSFAVDREAIVAGLWVGRTDIPRGFQSPAFGAMYIEDFPYPRHDPEAARRLLREAGYGGAPIPYRVMPNYYPLEVQTAQVLVEMWRAVGIAVRIEAVEGLSQARRLPIHAMWNESTLMFYPDPLSMASRSHGPGGVFQRALTRWANPEFNGIAAALETEGDLAPRRRLHRRALEILDHDDPPCVILHNNAVLYGFRRDISWRPGSSVALDFRRPAA
ncbi:oligopeptide ABC transporter substrate-binding protein [Roseomonas hellenica]|uniref:Oligopeptide ABC transporter substrate-binding protein n=1 Tax=Plastoroseomonas hellenica TaxID=2687306 RepID=A0ABS5EXX0_9PROT|nr:ABC transporter substrate-binding protein [Plastoroseomonas hellenica]MBR0665134.1 oligopeptide ABC transporter substrate-binding protein [Plastoroseomonas hellenica]